eukprot:TRINITY_DN9046_c0_g1_i1.p1 TRINITY_DN9046_c0_g1~~TRINITY_DN9046_c0_g1_i1.p1  ORF type:complete len:198 (-),score=38.50 TRINITY_DN9046_c0_g1_i1:274-828(-)
MAISLFRRPLDLFLVIFFVINLFFITYIVDFEQIMVKDPKHFEYPVWPPRCCIDLVHWWGNNFDPVLLARPPWWMATIWIDALYFGPFYAAAIYAFIKCKDWIRIPSIIWATAMFVNVTVILFEEKMGQFKTPRWDMVLFANAPWLLMPFVMFWRMRNHRPFSSLEEETGDDAAETRRTHPKYS